MSKVLDILKGFDIDAEIAEKVANKIDSEYVGENFVSKKAFNKKNNAYDDAMTKVAELEAKLEKGSTDEYKSKYEELLKTHEDYKLEIENKEINSNKSNLFRNALKELGISEELYDYAEYKIGLDNLELEDGKIKDWEAKVENIKNIPGLIPVTSVEGADAAKPPSNNPTKGFTREQINNMTPQEINANWDSISQSLSNNI